MAGISCSHFPYATSNAIRLALPIYLSLAASLYYTYCTRSEKQYNLIPQLFHCLVIYVLKEL